MQPNDFQKLYEQFEWKPIDGCPGRYVFSSGVTTLSPRQLLDSPTTVIEEKFPNANDPVQYCYFEGGGLISYVKKEGFLHTLCDADALKRKLDRLKNG